MFENTSVEYNTGKTDKFSTSLYTRGRLLTVSHHIVQVVMVAQHCFCCWVTNFLDNNWCTGIHVLHVTTAIMMANNVNTVQKNYIDQGSETNISSSLVRYRSCLLTCQTQPLYEKASNKSLCPACLSKWKILSATKELISATNLCRLRNLTRIVPNRVLKATLGVFTASRSK